MAYAGAEGAVSVNPRYIFPFHGEVVAMSRECGELLLGAIRRLSPRRKALIVLRLAGYTRDEVMRLFGWTAHRYQVELDGAVCDLRMIFAQMGIRRLSDLL